MLRNRVGRTEVHLSAVGFGTASLRLVPESQAVAVLERGFELGVDWIHTAPDYGGTEPIIARAIRRSGRDVTVLSQASWDMQQFARAFDGAKRMVGKDRLELFGVNCIDEAEELGYAVWGAGGMVEFLLDKRRRGELRGLFCSTHGPPEYVARLIRSGVFDAVMLAYNPLGFHALSYYGKAEGRDYEDIRRTEAEIFPLAEQHEVSLFAMKPLGGGLLCPGKAFPAHERFSEETRVLTATDVLKTILSHRAIAAVLPGTASIEEAEENALAGHAPIALPEDRVRLVEQAVREMRATLCSRCGRCETTCSRSLPISWMFRAGYVWSQRSLAFEDLDRLNYFHVHPDDALACWTCRDRTCMCDEQGLDIPRGLSRVHARLLVLREQELLPVPPARFEESFVRGRHALRYICADLPHALAPGERRIASVWVQNLGDVPWSADGKHGRDAVALGVFVDGALVERVPLRHDVAFDVRTHFAFELVAPAREGTHRLELVLMPPNATRASKSTTRIHERLLTVGKAVPDAPRPGRWSRRIAKVGRWLARRRFSHGAPRAPSGA